MSRYPSQEEYIFYICSYSSCQGNQLFRFFLPVVAVFTSESYVYFLINGYCYSFINPMNYHGPDLKKQHILFSPLMAILVALVTVFILGEFSEKDIFVHTGFI